MGAQNYGEDDQEIGCVVSDVSRSWCEGLRLDRRYPLYALQIASRAGAALCETLTVTNSVTSVSPGLISMLGLRNWYAVSTGAEM